MTTQELIAALALPAGCSVDQRVPKKLLLQNGAPTSGDKRLINEHIEAIHWIAALKPNTVGVDAYRDEQREYLEIALLRLEVRQLGADSSKAMRMAELVHRAIPYPVILLMEFGDGVMLSLARKRWAQNEAGKVVLDGEPVAVLLAQVDGDAVVAPFLAALALSRQPQAQLMALYQGWMDTVISLMAARVTGIFHHGEGPEIALARRQALQECKSLELELVQLRAQAAKEKQMAKRVDLNLTLQAVQARLLKARQHL